MDNSMERNSQDIGEVQLVKKKWWKPEIVEIQDKVGTLGADNIGGSDLHSNLS